MSKLSLTRDKIYKTVARQLHGVVPCWVCGEHVLRIAATLEHIKPLGEGGNSHAENLAISHELCNNRRHARGSAQAGATGGDGLCTNAQTADEPRLQLAVAPADFGPENSAPARPNL